VKRNKLKTGGVLLIGVVVAFQMASAAARKPADDIFLDHPSMDRNAVVMPAADAKPVAQAFAARPLLDASVTRSADGQWFMTGTSVREGVRDGIQLWQSKNGTTWTPLGVVYGGGHRYSAPDVRASGAELFLTFSGDDGCVRVAAGKVATPNGPYQTSSCLVKDVADASLFVDDDGTKYLVWGGGMIARLKADMSGLAETPVLLKPDASNFAAKLPAGKDWPVASRIGKSGATMFKHQGQYVIAANEVTGRMRTATDDVYMATAPSPHGPFSKRFLAVPHASQTSVATGDDGTLLASYNPHCEDSFALFCERVGFVPLERAPDGRLRQAASVITENSAVASRKALVTSETMRDPSATLGNDGYYYLVGTQGGFGLHHPEGGVKLWRSKDMKTWDAQGFILKWEGLGYTFRDVAELWAPELRWVAADKTYYLAFSIMERGVGGKTWLYRSTSGKVEGPYANVTKSYFVEGIDGFPFDDGDDLYLLWGGGQLGKLNKARDGFVSPPVRLIDTRGEHVGYEGNGLIKIGDTYFLTGAEWNGPLRTEGTYDMMYATSKSIAGPYSQRRLGAPHGGHGTLFRDAAGHYWYTMFGNDVTAPWRTHFGLVPLIIGDTQSIRVPSIRDEDRQ
jgi:beta-xylosidase